jgi:hypothetical protein
MICSAPCERSHRLRLYMRCTSEQTKAQVRGIVSRSVLSMMLPPGNWSAEILGTLPQASSLWLMHRLSVNLYTGCMRGVEHISKHVGSTDLAAVYDTHNVNLAQHHEQLHSITFHLMRGYY